MMRTLTICIFMAFAQGCGSKTLDIGGPPGGAVADGGMPDAPAGPRVTNSTAIVTQQRRAASLYSEGSHLYWSTYDENAADSAYEIWRCDKRDCSATRQLLFHANAISNLVIRGGRAYFRLSGGIVSCPVDDCSAPTVVIAPASGSPTLVDDVNVYWGGIQENAILSCPLAGCDKAFVAVIGIGTSIALAADAAQLYWTLFDPPGPAAPRRGSFTHRSAPKDGSGVATTLITGLTKPASLIIADGFVYWTEMIADGNLARCPTTGCPSGAEILTAGQYYPHHLALDRGVLFWLSEWAGADLSKVERPAKIMSCILSSCATTMEVLDEAYGGGAYDPTRGIHNGSTLVVDEDAVYYFGDFAAIGRSDAQGIIVDASIRRLPRRPRR